jgi:hypothetical protein
MNSYTRALPALLLSLVVSAAPALAAPVSDSADSRAIIVTPLSLVQVDDLDFGSLVPSTVSGVVTIDANSGSQSAIGGVTAYGSAVSRRAYFVGAGTEGQPVSIALSAPPSLSDGAGNSMAVLALTLDGPALRIIPADRVVHIYVGGILSVNANQAPGDYAGTFDMTVNYF